MYNYCFIDGVDSVTHLLNKVAAIAGKEEAYRYYHRQELREVLKKVVYGEHKLGEKYRLLFETAFVTAVHLYNQEPYEDPWEDEDEHSDRAVYFYVLQEAILGGLEIADSRNGNRGLSPKEFLESITAVCCLIENGTCTEEQQLPISRMIVFILKHLNKNLDL